jgi:hypothetical protein
VLSHEELLMNGLFRGRQLLALTVGGSVHDHVLLLSLAGSTKQLAKQLPRFEHLNPFVRWFVTHAVAHAEQESGFAVTTMLPILL